MPITTAGELTLIRATKSPAVMMRKKDVKWETAQRCNGLKKEITVVDFQIKLCKRILTTAPLLWGRS